jgi:LacI family transcriptional regulator
VERAVAELERQRQQVQLSGTSLMLDLVMQAPDRFAGACRRALEAELPSLRPATVRVRSHLREQIEPNAAADTLDLLAERGSDGVILKAPDNPVVVEAVGRVVAAGIAVVTFVTDVPGSRRVAYAGVDNRGAGATAAYLVAGWAAAEGRRAGHGQQHRVPGRGGPSGGLRRDLADGRARSDRGRGRRHRRAGFHDA